MSLIKTIAEGEGMVSVLCPQCGVSIGIMSMQEAGDLARANIQPLCFGCGPEEPDTIPVVLMEFCLRWFLHLGDIVLVADWLETSEYFNQKHIRLHKISLLNYFFLKTGWRDRKSPLVGSLNLNKLPSPKASSLVVDGELS